MDRLLYEITSGALLPPVLFEHQDLSASQLVRHHIPDGSCVSMNSDAGCLQVSVDGNSPFGFVAEGALYVFQERGFAQLTSAKNQTGTRAVAILNRATLLISAVEHFRRHRPGKRVIRHPARERKRASKECGHACPL